jgi:DNA-binding response OmpR family regulator
MDQKKIAKVLIIDDEKDILKSLKDTLTSENFEVITAVNGKLGIKGALESIPDVILLDLRLPDMDGYDVCRALKNKPETADIPIIILSTRSKHTEKVVGLEMGAEDYLTKPYNDLELLARIRVVLRRRQAGSSEHKKSSGKIRHGFIEVNLDARLVSVRSLPVSLTRKEFDLLAFFIDRKGKALSRAFILEALWGQDFDSLAGTIDTHVKTLRKKLGDAGSFIETIPGVGYRWADES